jgi:hypothetical protein
VTNHGAPGRHVRQVFLTARRAHSRIDAIAYLIAATVTVIGATVIGAALLTTNVHHLPMFTGLRPPYAT